MPVNPHRHRHPDRRLNPATDTNLIRQLQATPKSLPAMLPDSFEQPASLQRYKRVSGTRFMAAFTNCSTASFTK